VGNGFSTGAGSGSTKTQFTRVKALALGNAVVSDQPFTVLADLDLGMVMNQGKQQPIAGMLGLELFERFGITMDYKGRAATLQLPWRFICHANAIAVPLRFTNDMPLVADFCGPAEGLQGCHARRSHG
jgi:hypothetical protein